MILQHALDLWILAAIVGVGMGWGVAKNIFLYCYLKMYGGPVFFKGYN